MEFKNLEMAIQFAIQKEEASAQFYHDLSEHIENPATKIVLDVLRHTELQHKSDLELELMKMGKVVYDQPCIVPDVQDESHIEVDEEASKMNFIDALQLAISKERAAFVLYTGLMTQTKDVKLRKMFLDLAEEEMRHLVQFENEYKSIMTKEK